MNHCVPDWNLEDYSRLYTDLPPVSNQKIFLGPDQEFVELLWQNGLVVMNSQTHQKPIPSPVESEHVHKPEERLKGEGSFGNSSILMQEETSSWLQFPLDDLIENEFSDLFDIPTILDFKETNELSKAVAGGNRDMKVGDPKDICSVRPQPVYRKQYNLDSVENVMPPKIQVPNSTPQAFNLGTGRMVNFMHFLRPSNASIGWPNDLSRKKGSSTVVQGELAESSMMRNCGSNNQVSSNSLSGAKEVVHKRFTQNERWQIDALEPSVVSSSGGSEGSLTMTKETASNQSLKRKSRDIDESKCQSEEAEFVLVEANKPPQRSASTHQSRVAEVHNLSERRRRERINEKMKALQELIPHSNKSDKVSMLDETIEYLKSLQLQLQIMWMGNGMAQMMVPGVQNYMLPMGIGVDHAQIHGPLQSPRVPVTDQSLTSTLAQNHPTICPSPMLNSFRFQNQMQNANMPESYARYLGFHPVNCPSPMLSSFSSQNQVQNANMPESYARDLGFNHIQMVPQAMQHGQRMAPPVSSEQQYNGITTDNILAGTLGRISLELVDT